MAETKAKKCQHYRRQAKAMPHRCLEVCNRGPKSRQHRGMVLEYLLVTQTLETRTRQLEVGDRALEAEAKLRSRGWRPHVEDRIQTGGVETSRNWQAFMQDKQVLGKEKQVRNRSSQENSQGSYTVLVQTTNWRRVDDKAIFLYCRALIIEQRSGVPATPRGQAQRDGERDTEETKTDRKPGQDPDNRW